MDCSRLFAYLRNRRGATAVEFVLTFPFFIAIVFMIAETSIYFLLSVMQKKLSIITRVKL